MTIKSASQFAIKVVAVVAVVYAITEIMFVLCGKRQHDFYTYFYAARAYHEGLNPYDIRSLQIVSGQEVRLPFVYPPYNLYIMSLFAKIEYRYSYYLFLSLKLVTIVALLLLWSKIVPITKYDLWVFIPTVFLGYRSALLCDLRAGNVSVFEEVMIWGGIVLLLRGNSIAGSISLLASSVFKIVTIALGPLIFIIGRSWRTFLLWISISIFFAMMYAAAYTAQPSLWTEFITSASMIDKSSDRNLSSLAFSRDMMKSLGSSTISPYIVYGTICLVVSTVWMISWWSSRATKDRLPILYLTIFAYVLTVPRMKDYSLIIVLFPTLHTIGAIFYGQKKALLAYLLLCVPFFPYQSLAMVLWMFLALSRWMLRNRNKPNHEIDLTLNPLSGL